MRRFLPAVLCFAVLGPLPGSHQRLAAISTSPVVVARPVAGVDLPMAVGRLQLTEAWQLVSANSRFGGFSALTRVADRRFMLVSDNGALVDLVVTARGEAREMVIGEVGRGKRTPDKGSADLEAIAHDPGTGRFWLGVEGSNSIWRMEPNLQRRGAARPALMRQWRRNGGPEALTRLADRRFMVISESSRAPGGVAGVMFNGDPVQRRTRAFRFAYDPRGQGAPTALTALPDGRVLILHRRLGTGPLFRSSIAVADPRGVTPGAVLRSTPIGDITRHPLAENWEGMALERDDAGRAAAIWLVSDDNFNHWQRTLLIRLVLPADL